MVDELDIVLSSSWVCAVLIVTHACSVYDSSVANMSANTWDKLPVSTRNAKNIAVFKKILKNNSYKP